MRAKITGMLIVLGCFVYLIVNGGKPLFSQAAALENEGLNRSAPDFVLPALEGKSLRLSDFEDKVIILDFWATNCPPCRKGIPDFIKLYNKYRDKGLVIIGVSLDRGNVEKVKRFCQNKGVNYPVAIGNYEVTESYGGIRYIPTTFIIDKNKNIVKKFIGYTSIDVFEREIKTLLE
ncbi:MAG: redoxin domain-containing protein [Candidatus Auribacterota bacterium]|nr:redoxin domain-containing protein [Candidatus Auribacterota bacterium]